MLAVLVAWGAALMACHGAFAQSPAATPGSVSTDPFITATARIRPSVVAVGSYLRTDAPSVRYFGTGFVIDDGRVIVTNAHVIDAIRKAERIEQMRVFFPDASPLDGRPVTVYGQDDFHDLALLRMEGPAAPALTLAPPGDPPQGQSVGVMGYPVGTALGLVPAVHRGVVAAVVPAVLPLPRGARLTAELAEAIRRPYNLYQLDMVVFPGHSGSPLFAAEDGRVLGVINKTLASQTREHLLDKPTGISYAVPVRWVRELLLRCRAGDPPSAKSGESTSP